MRMSATSTEHPHRVQVPPIGQEPTPRVDRPFAAAERSDYGGSTCPPTLIAHVHNHPGLIVQAAATLDAWTDRLRERFHRGMWRAVGAVNKVVTRGASRPEGSSVRLLTRWRMPRPMVAPIFMVGSPRSGTTAVAKVLGRHRDLRLLSEARPIWYMAVPEMAEEQYHWEGDRIVGRMYLDQDDATPERQAVLEREFGIQLTLAGKKRLFEKFPANLFRVRWLHAIWPDCTFLHMVRDPFSTTASKSEHWPSIDDRKIPGIAVRRNLFRRLFPEYADLLATVRTAAEWYLFEWRVYIEEGERLQRAFPQQYGIFRFEDVQLDPESALRDMCTLAGLRFTSRVHRAYQTILDTRVQLAHPPIDRSRCAELLGDAPDRWGYHF